ncbi:MAG TPA: peptide chain release factor 2 [Clostridiales bacterium]|nr:peptide chain release factor 2 [Clostridiales bacterium]
MVGLEISNGRLKELKESFDEIGESLDIPGCERRIRELEKEMNDPAFWNDVEKSKKVSKELKHLKDRIQRYNKLVSIIEDVEVLIELATEEEDMSLVPDIEKEINILEKEIKHLRLETLLKGKYDKNNAIISLHAGAGGTEAMDWTSMLYRMYTRWCESKGYKVDVLDMLPGEEAGIKSVTFQATGMNAYGYLKAEKGVHRLVRISPFDSSGRRHTSFASVDVMPELEDDLEIEIKPDEIKVDTFRAGGAGGQHVNMTDSAVRITHIPTGIVVQCQNERSQIQNRETAMKVLKARLLELKEREAEEKLREMKGEMKRIEWGSQIRSYIFHPYSMVKDHRTGIEVGNIDAVMDGELDDFINGYLQMMV